jgi:hypothetical protein
MPKIMLEAPENAVKILMSYFSLYFIVQYLSNKSNGYNLIKMC